MIKIKYFLIFGLLTFGRQPVAGQCDTLCQFLKSIPRAEVTRQDSGLFSSFYQVMLPQKVNHSDENSKVFKQRIFVGHKSFDRPVVIVTEGYDANGVTGDYAAEPAHILDANQIYVEHRYFSKSVPDSMDWKYLNEEQAAADYHYIRTLFGKIYRGPWVATGVSKGGQTTVAYRVFYPHDVSVSIPYVAPINYERLDKRINKNLKKIGSLSCRNQLTKLQYHYLQHKKEILPFYKKQCLSKGYSPEGTDVEKIYDYSILEIPFSFRQYINCSDSLPDCRAASPDEMARALIRLVNPSWYISGGSDNRAAFYQFYTQLGYYEYVEAPYKKYLKYKDYPNSAFVPPHVPVKWDQSYITRMKAFLSGNPDRMIFVYGEMDPWSAVKAVLPANSNSLVVVQANGTHRAKIATLDDRQKKLVENKLRQWLQIPVHIK